MLRITLIAILLALIGCNRYKYKIELKPDGAAMERSLRVDRPGDNRAIGSDELSLLARAYLTKSPADSVASATFAGKFAGAMPQDVGGAGRHYTFETSLGTAHLYLERLRGQDDLLGQWERQEAAIDVLVDLLVNWAEREFNGQPDDRNLIEFLTGAFRRDVKNLALYSRWMGPLPHIELGADDPAVPNHIIRGAAPLVQYLVERSYLEPGDLPSIMRLIEGGDLAAPELMKIVRRTLSRKMGRIGVQEDGMQALQSGDAFEGSFIASVEASPSARQRLDRWVKSQPARKHDDANTQDRLSAAVLDALGGPVMSEFDEVTVRLSMKSPPVASNGTWEAADHAVTWSGTIETSIEEASGLPLIAAAMWADPNDEEQCRLFGSVVLKGTWLTRYCLLRHALTDAEASEWDTFLASLPEKGDVVSRLGAFRFHGQESSSEPPGIAKGIRDEFRLLPKN